MGEWDDAILVGVVARTQGNRGEVIVNLETDFPHVRFAPGTALLTRARDGSPGTLTITAMRMHQGRPVLTLAGIDSMTEAEALAGQELRVPPDAAIALPAGHYYHRDLVGCEVVTRDGEAIGRVTAVEGQGQVSRLIVSGGRREVMVPLADAICAVDLGARRITISPPEGLLEVNGDWR